ncbi:unnamed protein product [Closterium sp. NIES-65]|nr:unnamed protein product [Closterium sp. NIES-65]
MYITLYYIVTRLPDSLRLVRDHFLSVCPTTLTVDLLEERLLAAEKSIVAPASLASSRSERRLPLAGDAAPARARGARALEELAGVAEVEGEAVEGEGVVVGVVVGVEASVAAVEAGVAAAVLVGAEEAEEVEEAEVAAAVVEWVAALRREVAPVVDSASSSSSALVRPLPPSSFVRGTLRVSRCGGLYSTQRCFGRLTDAWRHQFPDATEIPRWGELSRAGLAIFDLDFDSILAAMYAVSTSDEVDYYLCVPLDPGIEAAALGAGEAATLGTSESAASGAGESTLSGTTSAQASHTFTLDSSASRSFFRDRTTLTPLCRPVVVSLADPSDDLQLFLQCDRADGLSLFDLTCGASPAPAADADATVRSQWATRDAAARLAVRCHLPTSERAHFSQYKSAQTLYDAVVARYSSPATTALSLTRLPDSLSVVRDHFLSVCPTTLTVNLLEKALLAIEKSIVAVGASRGDPRTPIFEGCSPSPLLPSVASAAAADLLGALEERAGAVEVEAAGGVGVALGVEVGVEVPVAEVEAEAAAAVVAEVAAVEEAAEAAVVAEAEEAKEVAGVAVDLVAA